MPTNRLKIGTRSWGGGPRRALSWCSGLEIPEENVILKPGDGLKCRSSARPPDDCMRWTGLARRALSCRRTCFRAESFAWAAPARGVQWMLGDAMRGHRPAADMRGLAAGPGRPRPEKSPWPGGGLGGAHHAVDTAIQLCGAMGYSRIAFGVDTVTAVGPDRRRRLGVHKMVLAVSPQERKISGHGGSVQIGARCRNIPGEGQGVPASRSPG